MIGPRASSVPGTTCLGNRARMAPRSLEATGMLSAHLACWAVRPQIWVILGTAQPEYNPPPPLPSPLPFLSPLQGPVVANDDTLSRNCLPGVPATGNLPQLSQSKFCLGCAFCTMGVWSRDPLPDANLPSTPSSGS